MIVPVIGGIKLATEIGTNSMGVAGVAAMATGTGPTT